VVDHGQQLGAERVKVDLLAQPGREGVHRAGGVIAAAVEAPVDQVLDAAAAQSRAVYASGGRTRIDFG
jgi:hypothetical protein